MSNPAVTTLCKTNVSGLPLWMDDNIGESIHLHIGDVRVDLTDKEFTQMYSDICDAINGLIDVEGFDCHKINPVFMEDMLWKNILHLKEVKIEKVELKKLLCPFYGKYVELPNSRAVRALNGDTKDNDDNRRSHHIGQTSSERLLSLFESVKKNGYPYNNEYIILYGDDFVIQDGQHRAACLWNQLGDVSVPVMRLYFDNYVNYKDLKPFKRTRMYYLIKTFKENVPTVNIFLKKINSKIRRTLSLKRKRYIQKKYLKKYGDLHKKFIRIYNE